MRGKSSATFTTMRLLGALAAGFFLLLGGGTARAEAPTFTIDNKVERERTFETDRWIEKDSWTQDYKLGWSVEFSPRLSVGTTFSLTLEDVINSEDVDTKKVTPSWEWVFTGAVWDAKVMAKDAIDYTNEFNIPRKDSVELGVDLNLTPYYLPPLKVSLKRLRNDQIGPTARLEDTLEDTLEVNTSYSFLELLDLDASYKDGSKDNRIQDNEDQATNSWDFNLNWGQLVTPSLKFDAQVTAAGDRTDTYNNAGDLVTAEASRNLERKGKLTLEAFPEVSTTLELSRKRDFVDDLDEGTDNLVVKAVQEVVQTGSLSETLEANRTATRSATEDSQEDKRSLTVEMTGDPHPWWNYSVKYTMEAIDTEDRAEAVSTREVKKTFDLSLTFTPSDPLTLDIAYNREGSWLDSEQTDANRVLKVKGKVDGEFLDVPNLTFNPSYEIVQDRDLGGGGADARSRTLVLEWKYLLTLPTPFTLELEPAYNWGQDGGETQEVRWNLATKASLLLELGKGILEVDTTGTYENILGDEQPGGGYILDKEFRLNFIQPLTGTLDFDLKYDYKNPGEGEGEDSVESSLTWTYADAIVKLAYSNSRTFSGEKNDTRNIRAEFKMDF